MKTLNSILALITATIAIAAAQTKEPNQLEKSLPWDKECKALASSDFSHLVDAPTQVAAANPIKGGPERTAYCAVQGHVSPRIGFKMGLPATNWNGKFLELGCGGACGSTSFFDIKCAAPMMRGYACLMFDAGHSGNDLTWASDLAAQVDFGYRSIHVVAIAGKEIVKRFYGTPAKYSYFEGSSTGGRQALVAAQRFPWDFDGIISGAPWINDTDSSMNMVWAHHALRATDGKPIMTRKELKAVHKAAIALCDRDDNIQDGLIGNPAACKFDPGILVCKQGERSDCLSEQQAEAVRKVYRGPTNSRGEKIYPGGAAIGSELGWIDEGLLDYIRSDGSEGGSEAWGALHFRYLTMPAAGPEWKVTDFNFGEDHKRFGSRTQESLLNAANPDLRKFKAAGGKLIIYQGWDDQSDVPAATIDYYETVTRVMGGLGNTQEFARLFMIPGMNHLRAGPGPHAIDYLHYLERWVEHDEAPNALIGAHVADDYAAKLGRQIDRRAGFDMVKDFARYEGLDRMWGAWLLDFPLDLSVPIAFTRPIYPYPLIAKYKGSGDANDAANFVPVEPAHKQPATKPELIDGAEPHIYKSVAGTDLRLFILEPTGPRSSDKRVAMVFFSGSCMDPKQFASQAKYFAQRGMVAAAAEYRNCWGERSSPFDAAADASAAIRWMRTHATELGVDPNQIVAAGGSAGGFAALSAAVFGDEIPNALVLFNPVIDWLSKPLQKYIPEWFGPLTSRVAEISPVQHLRKDLPPMIILNGRADNTTPYALAEKFCANAKALGNDCRLIGYDGADHSFFNAPELAIPESQGGKWYYSTVQEADRFLTSIGYLQDRSIPVIQEHVEP